MLQGCCLMKSCLMCADVCGVVVPSGLRLSQDGDIIIKDYQNAVSPPRAHLRMPCRVSTSVKRGVLGPMMSDSTCACAVCRVCVV